MDDNLWTSHADAYTYIVHAYAHIRTSYADILNIRFSSDFITDIVCHMPNLHAYFVISTTKALFYAISICL